MTNLLDKIKHWLKEIYFPVRDWQYSEDGEHRYCKLTGHQQRMEADGWGAYWVNEKGFYHADYGQMCTVYEVKATEKLEYVGGQ